MREWEKLSLKEQALHPETPTDRLHYLAHFHPEEVLQNPILPLLFLEDPTRAKELQQTAKKSLVTQRLETALANTHESIRRLWLCDCAERVLPFYDAQHPGDHRASEVLRVARGFAMGRENISALHTAHAEANSARITQRSTGIMYGSPPPQPRYREINQQIILTCAKVAAKQIAASDAFDIAISLAQIAASISLNKTRRATNMYQEPEPTPTEQITEMEWQAARLAELIRKKE
jgi:hypothetical protein